MRDKDEEARLNANIELLNMAAIRNVTYGIPLSDLETICAAWRDGRCVVLPEASPRDMNDFIAGLHDYFKEAAYVDRSVGINGMSPGEAVLADALMQSLTREVAEEAMKEKKG